MQIVIQVVLLVIGFAMLMKGADWFVEGASKIALKFGIPQLVIGLTIVAIGTSVPEAAVSLSAAMKGSAEITIGNVVGSNILNILLVLGLASVIQTISVQKSTIKYEIPFIMIVTIVLAVLGLADETVSRFEGFILLLLLVVYLIYLFRMAKSGQDATEEVENTETEKKNDSIWKMILLIVIGILLIVFGSDITVDAATKIAKVFGMSERLIGLTIVAFGTSLPELVTSVTAATKGKADIAIGNVVGSNIFNIVFIVGMTAMITPVAYSAGFMIDSIVALASAVILFLCVFSKKKLTRTGGVIMLVGYAAYFVYLLV